MSVARFVFAAAAATIAAAPVAAQSDSAAVIAVVQKLFDGMRKKDTASMRALFAPNARMAGVRGDTTVTVNPIDGWLSSIGRNPNGPVLDEKTWGYEVRIDGNVAQAWVQYALYVGDRFQHCGIDAFDLVKLRGEWKILSVMDTRRTTGCPTPPGGD